MTRAIRTITLLLTPFILALGVRGVPAQAQRGDVETLLYDMNAYAEENTRAPLDVEMEFAAGAGI